ncbi:hypothetical protein CA13_39260 [Planctomycetes bacterium CA13]|uniref:Uncharacterized protein n=1 Tax=Novipirellula herctigrandis TaxID=2527986 RepID=A0A5C5Z7J1_9BACT|nr:hypothetical protein CA13_39260 [Planctomycetes bacterium CA13]
MQKIVSAAAAVRCLAVQSIVAIIASKNIVVVTAIEQISTSTTAEVIVATIAVDLVITIATLQLIVFFTAKNLIVTRTSVDQVNVGCHNQYGWLSRNLDQFAADGVSSIAIQPIVPAAAKNYVVAATTISRKRSRTTGDFVIARSAIDGYRQRISFFDVDVVVAPSRVNVNACYTAKALVGSVAGDDGFTSVFVLTDKDYVIAIAQITLNPQRCVWPRMNHQSPIRFDMPQFWVGRFGTGEVKIHEHFRAERRLNPNTERFGVGGQERVKLARCIKNPQWPKAGCVS